MSAPHFFDLAKRPRPAFVADGFPFPLALTCARALATFDRQQPVEAAWAVRDAWEAAIKFCACVSVADYLRAGPDAAVAGKVAEGLLSSRGVAIGGWADALHATLAEPLREWGKGKAADTARTLPELWRVFHKPPGTKALPAREAVLAFAGWRNDVFGHGVFTHDIAWYAGQAETWFGKLVAFYEALKPALAGWALVGRTADGQTVDWSGCEFEPKRDRHRHDPVGHALPMFLVRDGVELGFGPLLSVQRCRECDHPAAFYFDRQKKKDETVLLEYIAGAKGTRKSWPEVEALSRWLPVAFEWTRQVYDTGEVVDGTKIEFRDFDAEYLRPGYLLDALRARIDGTESGYVLIDGPEGVGKSYLARGLAEKEADRPYPVLAYFVRPGVPTDYQFFASELNRQVKEQLGRHTLDLQLKATTAAELRAEFAEYFAAVLNGRGVILILDGLDELPDADPATPIITDLLPDPAKLPSNLHVVLTARAKELKPRAAARWQALANGGGHAVSLDPASAENRQLVTEYLRRHAPAAADAILTRSGGVFLYARHFVEALRRGVFASADELPPAERFYPEFLARIRARVGDDLFERVYLRLLMLLAAARVPVTREQLERWGLPGDRLAAALGELRDFVRQLRHRGWHEGLGGDDEPRYAVAHEAFLRYAEAHEADTLRAAHRAIAEVALRHDATKWDGLDPADDADLYDVRFVLHHCDAAGLTAEAEGLRGDIELAGAAWRLADHLGRETRHQLSVELYEPCIRFCRDLARSRPEVTGDLASALMNQGVSLRAMGRLDAALERYDESLALRRTVVAGDGRPEAARELVKVLANKGEVLRQIGRLDGALASQDEAIALLESIPTLDVRYELATAYLNKGIALKDLGRVADSVTWYDAAAGILQELQRHGRYEYVNTFALTLVDKGNALVQLGRLEEAAACYDVVIANRRQLVGEYGRAELAGDIGQALVNKGVMLRGLGRFDEALACLDEAARLLREQVEGRGRHELANELAKALVNMGNVYTNTDRYPAAVDCYSEAIRIRRRLVEQQQRTDLADELALVLLNCGAAQMLLDRLDEAAATVGEAVAILRRLMAGQQGSHLAVRLAAALVNLGSIRAQQGRAAEAGGCYQEAIDIWSRLYHTGETQTLTYLLQGLRIRFDLEVGLGNWPAAAECAAAAGTAFQVKRGVTAADEHRLGELLFALSQLTPPQRAQLAAAAGPNADLIRRMLGEPPAPGGAPGPRPKPAGSGGGTQWRKQK